MAVRDMWSTYLGIMTGTITVIVPASRDDDSYRPSLHGNRYY